MRRFWSSERAERLFAMLCFTAAAVPLLLVLLLLGDTVRGALPVLWSWSLLSEAMLGSLKVIVTTAIIVVPVGMGAAIYLEEYSRGGVLNRLIEGSLSILLGVPSILFGLLGLEVFVRGLHLSSELLVVSLTLSLLIFPLIVVSSRDALRMVPMMNRDVGHALGASRFQVVTRLVLPAALPGMIAGSILGLSRALGETAPLLVVSALSYASLSVGAGTSAQAALPSQLFSLILSLGPGSSAEAAACLLALVATVLMAHLLAFAVRLRTQREAS